MNDKQNPKKTKYESITKQVSKKGIKSIIKKIINNVEFKMKKQTFLRKRFL